VIGRPGSATWLLGHEIRLAWRGLLARRGRRGFAAWAPPAIFIVALLAAGVPLGRLLERAGPLTGAPFVVLAAASTAAIFMLMLSQTLAAAADTLYERGDLDLLFSSPVGPRKALAVRFLGVALNLYLTFGAFLGPLSISVAVVAGPRWLGALVVLAALALAASAAGLVLAVGLFRLIGPRRTRSGAQVASALIGAAMFLGTQGHMILSDGHDSLWRTLWRAADEGRLTPPPILALPLRAILGEPAPLATLAAGAIALYLLANLWLGARFAVDAAAAKGAASPVQRRGRDAGRFVGGAFAAVVRKELRLLFRDSALLSQVLLRVLYLIPLTVLLARSAARGEAVAVPGAAAAVVFMAGQVAGSLSWITISAEDAPDLISCAPTRTRTILRGKLAAALLPLAVLLLAPLAAVTLLSPAAGLVTTTAALAAGLCSGLINIWHQKPSRRGEFRRRRGATWYALWAEATVCGAIAGAAALATLGSWWALAPAGLAAGLMLLLRRSERQVADALRAA
jgi:ABC-2 type transport system permease protein